MPVYSNQAENFAGAPGQPGSASASSNPYTPPPPAAATPIQPVQTSPGLAFLLGLIPGVGAIYNGQYLKGLVHAGIFGMLVSLTSHGAAGEPLIGMIVAAFYFYMPFEAYHTAKKRQMGVRVDEWSSLLPRSRYADRAPIGPVILILIGVVFLLDSLHLVDFEQVGRFWPVILIVIGAYLLYSRVTRSGDIPPGSQPSAGQPGSAPHNTVMGGR